MNYMALVCVGVGLNVLQELCCT